MPKTLDNLSGRWLFLRILPLCPDWSVKANWSFQLAYISIYAVVAKVLLWYLFLHWDHDGTAAASGRLTCCCGGWRGDLVGFEDPPQLQISLLTPRVDKIGSSHPGWIGLWRGLSTKPAGCPICWSVLRVYFQSLQNLRSFDKSLQTV